MEKSNKFLNEKDRKEQEFKKTILNDDYIKWIKQTLEKYGDIDEVYFVHNNRQRLNQKDITMIDYLNYLFRELNRYAVKYNMKGSLFSYQFLMMMKSI